MNDAKITWDKEITWNADQIPVEVPLSPGWRLRLTTPMGRDDGLVRVVAYGPAGEANCADYTGEHCGALEFADLAFRDGDADMGLRMGWAKPGAISRMPEHEGW